MATILGIVLMFIWIAYLFEGRNEMNRRERLSQAFVFQWNVLPLITSLELLVTGNLFILVVGMVLFFVAWPFAKVLIGVLPFVVGWHLGMAWFSGLMGMETLQVYIAAVFSAVGLTILCQFVYIAMLSPPRTQLHG